MLIKKLALTALAVTALAAPAAAMAQDFGQRFGDHERFEAVRGFDQRPEWRGGWRRPYFEHRGYGYGYRPYRYEGRHYGYWRSGPYR